MIIAEVVKNNIIIFVFELDNLFMIFKIVCIDVVLLNLFKNLEKSVEIQNEKFENFGWL